MRWTPLRGLLAALVILLGVWTGISVHAHRPRSAADTVAVPAGQASPAEPPLATEEQLLHEPVQIPNHLPQFTLHDLVGRQTPISTWKDQSLVINFWATWCGPCRREIPLLNTLASQWQSSGVTFIGVAVDYPDKVRQFAAQLKIGYPLLVGEQDALDVAAAFGMATPVFPFTVFADRHGEVVTLFVGELHSPQAALILAVIHDLDQNKLDLPHARAQIAAGLGTLAAKST